MLDFGLAIGLGFGQKVDRGSGNRRYRPQRNVRRLKTERVAMTMSPKVNEPERGCGAYCLGYSPTNWTDPEYRRHQRRSRENTPPDLPKGSPTPTTTNPPRWWAAH